MLNNWRWTTESCQQSLVNYLHSSSFQHIFGYTCWCISQTWEQGICIISTCPKSLPHLPFLDHHCLHFIRKSGETVEDICTADGRTQLLHSSLQQKPLAPTYILPALQAELANLDSIYTSYKPLIITSTQLLWREPTLDDHVNFQQMHQEKPPTLFKRCPQLAHWNSDN